MIDIIVPTIPGREDTLERCRDSYQRHATGDTEVIVVPDSRTCGWGWRQGLAASRSPYVLLACDDQECVREGWDEICTETVDRGVIPCPRVWLATGVIESNGGSMDHLNHVIPRPQRDGTEVDYTTVPFLSAEMAGRIGMIDVHYASDVWVSYRGRQLGYPTELRHGFDLIHHRSDVGRGAGYSVSERDDMDCTTVFDRLAELETVTA